MGTAGDKLLRFGEIVPGCCRFVWIRSGVFGLFRDCFGLFRGYNLRSVSDYAACIHSILHSIALFRRFVAVQVKCTTHDIKRRKSHGRRLKTQAVIFNPVLLFRFGALE